MEIKIKMKIIILLQTLQVVINPKLIMKNQKIILIKIKMSMKI
jgi:hypothetical protein